MRKASGDIKKQFESNQSVVPKDAFEHLQLVMIRVVTYKQNMGHHPLIGVEDTRNMEQVQKNTRASIYLFKYQQLRAS